MTKFIGYDSVFYNNLPYSEKRDLIERRFHKSAKRKHEIKIIIQKEKHAQYTLVSFYWKIQTETDDKEVAWSVDAEAQNRLGHRYFHGNGTQQDIVQAIHWYRESAKGGCEAGMLHLAEYYKNRKQYKEAAKWYRQYVEARIKWRNKRLG